jgi:hypothetical protein
VKGIVDVSGLWSLSFANSGFKTQDSKFKIQNSGFKTQDSRLKKLAIGNDSAMIMIQTSKLNHPFTPLFLFIPHPSSSRPFTLAVFSFWCETFGCFKRKRVRRVKFDSLRYHLSPKFTL